MQEQHTRHWTKHFDFMVIDIVCLQICFVVAFWIAEHFSNPYDTVRFRYVALVLIASQLLVVFFANNYQGILRRGPFAEAVAVLKHIAIVFIIALVYLFIVRESASASRLQYGLTFVFFFIIDYALRQLNKLRIYKTDAQRKKSLVLVASSENAAEALKKLTGGESYRDYFVSGLILLDGDPSDITADNIPVVPLDKDAVKRVSHGWVDEALILLPDNAPLPSRLMNELIEMGITVNFSLASMEKNEWPFTDVREFGGYKVLTAGIRFASVGQLALKRLLDIVGGAIGCVITAILFIFIAPAIYSKSPGPIFFKQERVGRNGKIFQMYKFRSMYMDAEERKAELAAQNQVEDGMMFKIADDPRIIGSEKKDSNGDPKGIGNFIRNYSLDEFPQFFNVLKGDMSLVGTRPPTLDEWERYELGHRIRMSVKPGITGMWQISGRSQIRDFNEVVRLDREYIENWTIALDVKILLKTIVVVTKRKGAM